MADNKIHIDKEILDIVRQVKEFIAFVLRYWYLLILFVLLGYFVGKRRVIPTTTQYVANLTFTINQSFQQQESEEGQVASLITDFGMSSNANREINTNRLIELSKSTAVLSAVLFREYEVEGEINYLANHYLNLNNPNVKDSTYFEEFVSLDSLSRTENAMLNSIIGSLKAKNLLFSVSPAYIFKLTTTSKKEELSKVMAEAYFEALSDLYTKGAIAKAEATYEFTEERLEEATADLLSAESALANWQDRNQNLIYKSAYLTQLDLERKVSIFNSAYLEALSSFEIAKMKLENQRPIFQLIDPPRYPLQRVRSGGGSKRNMFMAISFVLYFIITSMLYLYKRFGYLLREILRA